MNHTDINPSLTDRGQLLIIFAQPTIFAQPGKGALNHPTLGQHRKAFLPFRRLDDLQHPAKLLLTPLAQRFTAIGAVQQHLLDPTQARQAQQQRTKAALVLPIGGMHQDAQQQTEHIDNQMPLASAHVFAAIPAARPPFSVVLTDWLSPMRRLGSASRPALRRTRARKASLMRSQVRSRLSLRKYVYTVCHFGRSCGIRRQLLPLRSIYKMALRYSRALSSGVCLWGSKAFNCSHSWSLKSVGYASRSLMSCCSCSSGRIGVRSSPLFYSVI